MKVIRRSLLQKIIVFAVLIQASTGYVMAVGNIGIFTRSHEFKLHQDTIYDSNQYFDDGKPGVFPAKAFRDGDFIFGLFDHYTGELATYSKVTGALVVDSVIIRKRGTEYFKRTWTGAFDVRRFGVKADCRVIGKSNITVGTKIFTSSEGYFTGADIGKYIVILGAGNSGANHESIIQSVQSTTQVTIADNALTSVSSAGGQSVRTFYGTDNTTFIQNAVNAMVRNNGGDLIFPIGGVLVSGTIVVDPSLMGDRARSSPINLIGATNNVKENVDLRKGSFFVKVNPGDAIRLNLNLDGSPCMFPMSQYVNFSINGLGFKGDDISKNVYGIRAYRTRMKASGLFCTGMAGFIIQPEEKQDGYTGEWDNYCDQSVFENIRMQGMLKQGLVLNKADASVLNGIYYEYPWNGVESGIEILNSYAFNITGTLQSNGRDSIQTGTGTAFIKLVNCSGYRISGVGLERSTVFESVFSLKNCQSGSIEGIQDRFAINNLVTIENTSGLQIQNLFSWSNKNSGYSDINFVGTTNSNIEWNNLKSVSYPGYSPRGAIVKKADGTLVNYPVAVYNNFISNNKDVRGFDVSNNGTVGTMTESANLQYFETIRPTVQQSGTAGYTALHINPKETSVGTGAKRLFSLSLNDALKFTITNTGLAKYLNDLSATYDNRSLTDKEYVDKQIALVKAQTVYFPHSATGDGIEKDIVIPHSLGTIPGLAVAIPESSTASGVFWTERTSTSVILHYSIAPAGALLYMLSLTR